MFTDCYIYAKRSGNDEIKQWLKFDDCMQDSPVPCWRIGRRGLCFIGVYCTHTTIISEGKENAAGDSDSTGYGRTIVCKSNKHAWVVFVGTRDEYTPKIERTSLTSAVAGNSNNISDDSNTCSSEAVVDDITETALATFTQRCLSITTERSRDVTDTWVVCDEEEGDISV